MTLSSIKKALVKFIAASAATAAMLCVPSSCHHLNDDRIPPASVRISFDTVAEWNTYGLGGATDWTRFIRDSSRDKCVPRNYPWTELTYTGYGGVLLVIDVLGEPRAFDLSCPVECKRDVRVEINSSDMVAVCPKCHSTYDVFSLLGHPLSGLAAERGYGLRIYRVGPGRGGEYMVVTN